VNNALEMGGSQTFGDGCGDLHRPAPVELRAPETPAQRLAFQQFSYGVTKTAMFAKIINAEQVGMRQRGNNAGFAMKAGQSLWVADCFRRQYLDRDVTAQLRIGGAINFAHTTGAEQPNHFIPSETSTGCQRHIFNGPDYCSLAYSALTSRSTGMSGSASFHRAKKSW
jgi:hypothetical protein